MSLSHPPAEALIQAIQSFLVDTVTPQVDKHTAFHIKVTCHILGILQREISEHSNVNAVTLSRLQTLLAGDNARSGATHLNALLCEKIRERSLNPEDSSLLAALREMTEARLSIDNPHYSGLAQSRARHGTD